MIHTNPSGSSTRGPRRRGVAMMLVLISLAVATIITSAYVASRDNSSLIGQNVVASAGAREAAISGIELGVAILQTESEWRFNHMDGRLLEAFPLDGGEFDLDLIDAETDMPPTEETRIVELTSTARVDGIAETATAVAEIFGGGEDAGSIDIDLSEFGVFASDKLRMENFATINRWSSSPLAGLGNGINVGTQADTAGTIELIGDAAAIDTTVFTGPSPSGSLVQNAGGPSINVMSLLDVIPMPDPPSAPFVAPSSPSLSDLDINGGTSTVSPSPVLEISWLRIRNSGKLTLSGDGGITMNGLQLSRGSQLLIDGNVELAVHGMFEVDDSSIELLPGATLRVYVDGALSITDGYLGDGPFDPVTDLDTTGDARWMEPERLVIYSMPTISPLTQWKVNGASVVKGRLYAKDLMYLELRHTSAFYGNVVANEVRILEQAAIFYDHTLDSGNGYTIPNSGVFDEFDHIMAALLSLASLDTADVQAAADAMNVAITNGLETLDGTGASAVVEEEPEGPGPTPRPLLVEYEITSIGGDSSAWEGT